MSANYPSPPIGLRLKLSRARRQLRQLRRTFDRFLAGNPARWVRSTNAGGTHYLYRLEFAHPPDSVQFLADEAVHHLRTCLDHVITALAEASGQSAKGTQFPVLKEEPLTAKATAAFEKQIGGIKGRAREIVVEAQPYQHGEAAERHPLWILARLDNRFKHTSVHMFALSIHAPMLPGTIRPPLPATGLRDSGDVFAAVPIDVDVEEDFEPFIEASITFRFQRIGIEDVGLDTLDEIYDFVRDEVLRKVLRGRLPPRMKPAHANTARVTAATREE